MSKYGLNRVLEPQYVLPTSAWRLDNSRDIREDELRIDVKLIHLESTNFKQICIEANDNDAKMKQLILDIVIRRGKLHNPVTDTGGVLYGTVSEIGKDFDNDKGYKPGDEVICNASLASFPLYIERIISIDKAFGQIEVEGYAILHNKMPIIRKPEGLPTNLLLYVFDKSGTIFSLSRYAEGKQNCLVVGNNLVSNLIFGYAIRKVVGKKANIVCLFDKKTDVILRGETIDELMEIIFNKVYSMDILKPIECIENLDEAGQFDLTVNCADIPGVETVNILAAKDGGNVVFANFINNYNIALYITEALPKQLVLRCADGYIEEYDEYDMEIVEELIPYFEAASKENVKVSDDAAYPITRNEQLREASGQRKTMVEDFICESRAMANVLNEMLTVAKYDCNVLITGDTGVGKEKVANIIYKNSNRKMQSFIKVNCASISPTLIESEFFGYEKGAFTGANNTGKKGYFELADNGTLFLDEIGELPLDMQAKLLRVIQDGEFYRVGGTQPVKTNVRIISATNRNLEQFIENNSFRRDLYYRLNVVKIAVPTLKERQGDIPALVRHFLSKYGKKFDIRREMQEDALEYMKTYDWPGNIRELENTVQRLMISAKGEEITLIDVMKEMHNGLFNDFDAFDSLDVDDDVEPGLYSLDEVVDNFEKLLIKHACEKYGSTRKTAKAIGISQTQLVRKKKKYDL